jgi:lysophospholipase L1-like esterase
LVLAAVSLTVVISSTATPGSGSASTGAGLDPDSFAGAPPARPGGTATQCRVTPRASPAGRPRPLLVTLGASFTAGVGAGRPGQGWAVRLAELIGWQAVTIGVPGAGYAAPGLGRLGPLPREVTRARLSALHPSLVIVQAGHDDLQVPAAREAALVARLVRLLRAEAPAARLAFVTVFSRPGPAGTVLTDELSTDAAIVSAIRAADARAIVMDPLRSRWRFPRAGGGTGLHPSSSGHLVIAERVAQALARAGVTPSAARRPQPATVTCARLAAGPADVTPRHHAGLLKPS